MSKTNREGRPHLRIVRSNPNVSEENLLDKDEYYIGLIQRLCGDDPEQAEQASQELIEYDAQLHRLRFAHLKIIK